MENKIIAKIKLNPGNGGYFDPISRIHLTHGNPFADVLAGTNTTGLKKAVWNRRISLVSGSLGPIEPPFKLVKDASGRMVLVPNNTENKKQEVKIEKQKKEEPKVEEPKVEKIKEEIVEEVKEEKVEEPVVEETKEEVVEETTEEIVEEAEEATDEEESTEKKKRKKKKKSGK